MAYSDDCLLLFLCILVLVVTLLPDRVERKMRTCMPGVFHLSHLDFIQRGFCSPALFNTLEYRASARSILKNP